MSFALLFPGQGSQAVGMGRDLFEESSLGRRRYEEANDLLGHDIAAISFQGPEETLKRTENTQPALFVVSVILAELLLARGVQPSAAAGHSLGEYSALAAAGVFSFADGLRLVRIRAEAMMAAGRSRPGTMAAVMGAEEMQLRDWCADAAPQGTVIPANFNSPAQIVISGEVAAVRRVMELARGARGVRAVELNVSGAFHSPLMAEAKAAVVAALDGISLQSPRFPILPNVTAVETLDPAAIRGHLIEQLDHPVLWTSTIRRCRELGCDHAFEIGPGNVLQGLCRRIDPSLTASGIETLAQVNEVSLG